MIFELTITVPGDLTEPNLANRVFEVFDNDVGLSCNGRTIRLDVAVEAHTLEAAKTLASGLIRRLLQEIIGEELTGDIKIEEAIWLDSELG